MRKKNWPLVLALAGAALALQACDVTVHETPKQDSTASSAPATDPAPPATDSAAATAATPATAATDTAAAAPSDTPAAVPSDTTPTTSPDATAMANPQSAPQSATQQPGTNAMGGPAAPEGQAQPSALDSTPAGTAAPTELARFLQENPPGGKDQKSASSGDTGSSGTQKANATREAGNKGKS